MATSSKKSATATPRRKSAAKKPVAKKATVATKPARPAAVKRPKHTVEAYNLRVQVLTTVFTTLCVIFAIIAAVQYR